MRRLVLLCALGALAGGALVWTIEDELRGERPVLNAGEVVSYPGAGVRCEATQEGGAPSFLCRGTRLDVVLFDDELFVYRSGEPDRPVFSARR